MPRPVREAFVPPKIAAMPGYGVAGKGPVSQYAPARGRSRIPMRQRIMASPWIMAAILALVVLCLMGSLLFSGDDVVISRYGGDMTSFFVPYRQFASDQMRAGHIPLWNPHTLCGTSFVGGFQSAIFYPFTWLHLLLPLALTINWTVAAEMFLAASFMALCCRQRGIGRIGSMLAGLAYIFSGSLYLRLYAGHLATYSTMTWAPLALLCIEYVLEGGKAYWAFLGACALTMTVLAGGVPSVYQALIVFGLYTLARWFQSPRRWRALSLLLLMGTLALSLSAVQLLPGLRTASEAVRSSATDYQFSSECPVPPENLMTLIAPHFWGDPMRNPYMGRWWFWESNLYIGTGILLLSLAGLVLARWRNTWPIVLAILVSFALALGIHAHVGSFNLFHFLYYHFPFYDHFRGTGRFAIFVALFMAILAGMGVDELARGGARAMRVGLVMFALAIIVGFAAAWLWGQVALGMNGQWAHLLGQIRATRQSYADPGLYDAADKVSLLGGAAVWQLIVAAGVAGLAGILAMLSRRWPRCAYAIAVLAAGELIVFAFQYRDSGAAHLPLPSTWAQAQSSLRADERVMHVLYESANQGMTSGVDDVYGYDPVSLKRYSQLLAKTQRMDPGSVPFVPPLNQFFRMLRLMRCRWILVGTSDSDTATAARWDYVLPRLQLIDSWQRLQNDREILDTLTDEKFDAGKSVILEDDPVPAPVQGSGSAGSAQVVAETTDTLEIVADLNRPAILVIGDAYSQDWHAKPLAPSAQSTYRIMPGDYAFRAIPLAAGKHHFLMQYQPAGFLFSAMVSILSAVLCLGVAAWYMLKRYI
jgi:hypothetical protein